MTDPMAALRARFVERCRADLARLRSGCDDDELVVTIHRLAGSAGSFGFGAISVAAARLDEMIRLGDAPGPEDLAVLISELEAGLPPAPESEAPAPG